MGDERSIEGVCAALLKEEIERYSDQELVNQCKKFLMATKPFAEELVKRGFEVKIVMGARSGMPVSSYVTASKRLNA